MADGVTAADAASPAPAARLRVLDLLPRGGGLPDDLWAARHRVVVRLAALHAVALFAFGLWRSRGLAVTVAESGLVALMAGLAAWPALSRRANAGAAALAFALSTLVLVQLSGGRTEAHFHAFLAIAVIALYQEWTPLALALLGIAGGLFGAAAVDPALLHGPADALEHPWRWGLVLALALAAEAAVLAALWTGLENQRNRTAVVLDSAGEAVLGLSRAGEVTFANPAAARLFGTAAGRLIGRSARALMRGLPLALDEAAGGPLRGHVRTAGGRDVAVEWTVSPKRRAGATIGWVVVLRDVGARLGLERQLEARSRQQAAVAELGREALSARSLDDLLQRVMRDVSGVLGASHCKLLELTPDGRQFLMRAGVGWRPGLVGNLRLPAQERSQSAFTLRQDGPVVVEDLRSETRFSGAALLQEHGITSGMTVLVKTRDGPFGVLGVHSAQPRRFTPDDIHFLQAVANLLASAIERSRVDDELRGHRASLEAQVAARTKDLTAANQELEAFSYTVSHDLRSPLRSIDGFSRILLRRHGEDLPQDSRDLLRMLSEGAVRMGDLIESVLSMTRIGRVDLRDEPFDLSMEAQEILAGLRAREAARRVAWSIEPGLVARGDPGLIRLVLENLLANAWKFTGKVDPAFISVRRVRGGAVPVFAVQDNGAGFDMAHAGELFQPFHRLHEPAQFQGTGIGLATVSRVVRRHGGHIWAQAAVGQGATFFFTLEPGLDLASLPPAAGPTPPALAPHAVLLADA